MPTSKAVQEMSKDELLELIELYAKNWLALDGVWFQTVERKYDMDEAMYHDKEAWRRFAGIEARRLKAFLKLPEHPGIDGLVRALSIRFYAHINQDEILIDGNTLLYRVLECRVQNARQRKGMEYHPCKEVGLIEYDGFAKAIDDRFTCECVSCYPDVTDHSCKCAWLFTLQEKI